jgi:propanol-preferring alcohol dehydrogenase
VTANTRADGEEFLRLAARMRLEVTIAPFRLADANAALSSLAADRITGAAVLIP